MHQPIRSAHETIQMNKKAVNGKDAAGCVVWFFTGFPDSYDGWNLRENVKSSTNDHEATMILIGLANNTA